MKIVTRFAPSPTGFLHIGGARTALFNYLFAKKHAGKFFLRIEDTDTNRSTIKATQTILSSLKWLGINWDQFSDKQDHVYQSQRITRHQEVAFELLRQNKAYKCFATIDEIQAQRQQQMIDKKSFLFTSKWRDIQPDKHPSDQSFVIRFKTPKQDLTIIPDIVHGDITFENQNIEDFILLKNNLEPLYNLCAVVDDYDMGISHIIRGQDHITNAARQILIYQAMGWDVPQMAHIPLIHGQDGTKLSKRHGATNVEDYKLEGYLPQAIVSYISRLGCSYQNDQILSIDQAIELFDIQQIGKSCARIDFDKLKNINSYYIKHAGDKELTDLVIQELLKQNIRVDDKSYQMITQGISSLKIRANLITELTENAKIYLVDFTPNLDQETMESIIKNDREIIQQVIILINNTHDFNRATLQAEFKKLATQLDIKLGQLMQPIRLILTGSDASPSVFEILEIIGKNIGLMRLERFLSIQ